MMFAASYYWYPMLTGRMYDRRLAIFQSSLLVVGSALTFMALMALGFLSSSPPVRDLSGGIGAAGGRDRRCVPHRDQRPHVALQHDLVVFPGDTDRRNLTPGN